MIETYQFIENYENSIIEDKNKLILQNIKKLIEDQIFFQDQTVSYLST